MEAVVMDVDQVLLDYYARLREWVNTKYNLGMEGLPDYWDMSEWMGVSKDEAMDLMWEFSTSYEFGTLDSFPGADVVLHSLMRDGYKLICVTACGKDAITVALRKANLFHRFGDIFTEVHFVEFTESKVDTMLDIASRYDIVAFIDDKPQNIEEVYDSGCAGKVVLMKAPHNREWRKVNNLAYTAFSWYECRQYIKE